MNTSVSSAVTHRLAFFKGLQTLTNRIHASKDTDEIMLLTAKNQSVRCPVNGIRETGRGAKGVKLIDLAEGDKLLSIARIVDKGDEEEAPAAGDAPSADAPAS